jgi:hypothetical protein
METGSSPWHVRGAKLAISQGSSDLIDMIPSWTWASVAYDVVVNGHAKQDGLRSFAVVEDVQVDLADRANPFGAVRGGSITITGPIFAFSRLYNKEWQCKETRMPAFERYVSQIIEEKSAGEVEEKFSSFNGRFAALLMFQHFPSVDRRLELLILETTGGTSNCMTIHRRLGVLSLRYIHQRCIASPELLKVFEVSKGSLRSRLGADGHRRSRKLRQSKDVFEELAAKPWPSQTIIIV